MLEGGDHFYGYVAAMNNLTINEESRLKQKLVTLQTKNEKIEGRYQQQ